MLHELVDQSYGSMSEVLRAGLYHMYFQPDCKLRAMSIYDLIIQMQKVGPFCKSKKKP